MEKVGTVNQGKIAATELDVARANAINALLTRPVGVLPAAPGEPIRPFAIALFADMKALLKAGVTVTALRRTTSAYVFSKRYYLASAQADAMRHCLDGEAVEPLSVADRLVAQKQLEELKRKHAREDAARQVVAPPQTKADLIRASLLGRQRS